MNPGRPGLPGGPTSPGKPSTPVWKSHRSHSPCPHYTDTFEEALRRARGLTRCQGPLAPAGAACWPRTVGHACRPPCLFPTVPSSLPSAQLSPCPPRKQNKDRRGTSSPGRPSDSAAPSTALFGSLPGSPRADPRLHRAPGRPTRSGASSAATASQMRRRPTGRCGAFRDYLSPSPRGPDEHTATPRLCCARRPPTGCGGPRRAGVRTCAAVHAQSHVQWGWGPRGLVGEHP